jgi:hypothetical protein
MGVLVTSGTLKDDRTRLNVVVRNVRNLSGTLTCMRMRNQITILLDVLDLRTMRSNRVTLTLDVNGRSIVPYGAETPQK